MKLETFFNKFDELADTPNGLKQLRELVLQLAVEGGLVPHSATEPAVPYASVEAGTPINVSAVPENWRVVLLADAIKNRSGNSKLIKGKLYDEPATGRFQGFSASGADVWCDDFEHEGEAIIISAVGARCGKAFKASGKWSAIANTNIARPEPTLFDFDFAYLVLNNEHFWVRGGSAQPFVKFPPSLDRHFALPPRAEQKRIVAKVDELMAFCDRLEAQQQERQTQHAALAHASLARFADAPTPANLQLLFHSSYSIPPADLRKSILTLAVQGKLVPQDPNDEPVGALNSKLPKQLQAIADKVGARFAAPTALVEANDDLPPGWGTAAIQSIGITQTGTTPSKSESSFTGRDIPFIKPGDIQGDVVDYDNEGLSAAGLSAGRLVPKNSVLMVSIGGSIGKTAIVDRDVSCNQQINCVTPAECVDPYFVLSAIRSGDFQSEVLYRAAQTTLPIISKSKWETIRIPIPPLAEQRRIVAKVDQLMALVDQLEAQLAASRTIAQELMEAIVAELTA